MTTRSSMAPVRNGLLVVLLCAPACHAAPPTPAHSPSRGESSAGRAPAEPHGPTAPVTITTQAGKRIVVHAELAVTPLERARGLMFRKALPPDGGMLFLMGRDADHTFWMKNTLIPLDMIFIDSTGVIAGIVHEAAPRTLDSRHVGKPSRYVLEVRGGYCKAHGIRPGDVVDVGPALALAAQRTSGGK